MIQDRIAASTEAAIRTGQAMIAAAVTAPKGNGVDDVKGVLLTGEDKDILASHMRDIADETGEDFYARDAGNVDNSVCVVLLWAENAPLKLTHCGLCGFKNCGAARKAGAVCARSGYRSRLRRITGGRQQNGQPRPLLRRQRRCPHGHIRRRGQSLLRHPSFGCVQERILRPRPGGREILRKTLLRKIQSGEPI